jgi:SagB-type dehydrogenase family enzyme
LDSHFLDLGLNSIDIIRMVNALDAQLGFRPDIESLYASPTIDFLAAHYAQWAKTEYPHAAVPCCAQEMAAPVVLPSAPLPAALETLLYQRRSIRQFALRPVHPEDLSMLLATIQPREERYAYASASSLYPVQIYLYARRGGITGLAAGPYFYDPAAHALRPLGPAQHLLRSAFSHQQNAPIFDEASFALLLVAQMQTITPSYAERSLHLATLEAGLMTQTLELAAVACNLGLCQIGSIDTEAARKTFGFSATQKILHVIFGGSPDNSPMRSMPPDATEDGRLKRLIRRVAQLPPDTVHALLGTVE